ncbi:MAG: L,D-transpeptidase [Deltaproteobacteria bacterium]|nr:L,D-transpeptidase [Deltaproteobacteria bacterium]
MRCPTAFGVALAVLALAVSAMGGEISPASPEGADPGAPILMMTRDATPVHTRPGRCAPVSSRIGPGAVIRVSNGGAARDCPQGWMEREGGGFICGKHLRPAPDDRAGAPSPPPGDQVGLAPGLEAVGVEKGGARLFRKLADVDGNLPWRLLYRGSALVVRAVRKRSGLEIRETREGMYVEADRTKSLPPPINSLGVAIAADETPATVAVGGGRTAHVRTAPRPDGLSPGERWIAVDLAEQLVHAYEGERLVYVAPCSTGAKGNTTPGAYRIELKRRAQTMQLRGGHVRVEDVEWIMYYDKARGIAIHSAYWHADFGTPASHGCVNLPRLDAKWIYDWSAPHAAPEDSEIYPVAEDAGTRVLVFE